jgi:DNA repair exonuclease SbcCD ATPase subunit
MRPRGAYHLLARQSGLANPVAVHRVRGVLGLHSLEGKAMNDELPEEPTEEDIKQFAEIKKEAERTFYYAIGRSITSWSITEGHLVYIAAMLLDTTSEKAGLVLYSITNFYTWLSIIDELFAIDPKYQPLRSDWTAIAERLKKLNDVRVRLAHHAVQHGKGIEVIVAGGDENEIFPSLKSHRLDRRNKTQKLTRLQMEELGDFATNLTQVFDAISSLVDRMEPIFGAERKALSDRIKQVRQQVTDFVRRQKEFPEIAGG